VYTLLIANKNYSSWSMRPWVLMRALELPFQERIFPFTDGWDPAELRKLSPSGRVPCLMDGEVRVWDSLAIMEYLAERHPGVWPADANARAWARSACAEMHSGFGVLRNTCGMNIGIRVRLNEVSAGLKADLARLESLWADGLARHGGPFLGGRRFTAVDAFFAPVATRVQTYDLPVNAQSREYLARLLALPAVGEWSTAGIAETWRDQPHEADVLAAGTIVQDQRRKA